jgi:hypothetical protein
MVIKAVCFIIGVSPEVAQGMLIIGGFLVGAFLVLRAFARWMEK